MKSSVMLEAVHTHTHTHTHGDLIDKKESIKSALFMMDFRRVDITCLFCVVFKFI